MIINNNNETPASVVAWKAMEDNLAPKKENGWQVQTSVIHQQLQLHLQD
jgi:hypothetical protein